MKNNVTNIAPASASRAREHFESFFEFETDCWDVHDAFEREVVDFVLVDVRGSAAYQRGHLPGAISLPRSLIDKATLGEFPEDSIFIVYCAGPHCNGAQRAGKRLATLGWPVKMMIGGVTGWLDEGFDLTS